MFLLILVFLFSGHSPFVGIAFIVHLTQTVSILVSTLGIGSVQPESGLTAVTAASSTTSDQNFQVNRPNVAWVTDITYIRTWQGWLYLATVLDLYARKVVGWSMKPTLSKEIVIDALLMAVWRRKPTSPVIVHSDQGAQYGSDEWGRFCAQHNLVPSMSRRGNCYDNAVAESFFSSLKKERIRKKIYRTHDEARTDIFDYIEVFYNRRRRHSHLGGLTPEAFERTSKISNPVPS